MRGEYSHFSCSGTLLQELPPRARRIRQQRLWIGLMAWNYLRVRGEYYQQTFPIDPSTELPPRARRILRNLKRLLHLIGTTSACAENTSAEPSSRNANWNYLRVRGEYGHSLQPQRMASELPPRARRILTSDAFLLSSVGTTSACAENTNHQHPPSHHRRNYLRVRGEYAPRLAPVPRMVELPPRARRIPGNQSFDCAQNGTTSACAENTFPR